MADTVGGLEDTRKGVIALLGAPTTHEQKAGELAAEMWRALNPEWVERELKLSTDQCAIVVGHATELLTHHDQELQVELLGPHPRLRDRLAPSRRAFASTLSASETVLFDRLLDDSCDRIAELGPGRDFDHEAFRRVFGDLTEILNRLEAPQGIVPMLLRALKWQTREMLRWFGNQSLASALLGVNEDPDREWVSKIHQTMDVWLEIEGDPVPSAPLRQRGHPSSHSERANLRDFLGRERSPTSGSREELRMLERWDDLYRKLDTQNLVVIGNPGFGKTWLLHYQAMVETQDAVQTLTQASSEMPRTPVFVSCRRLAATPGSALTSRLAQQFRACGLSDSEVNILETHFVQHGFRLFLDSWDEANEDEREVLSTLLGECESAKIPGNTLLSSRPVGLGDPAGIRGWQRCQIEPLEPSQCRNIADLWDLDPHTSQRLAREMHKRSSIGQVLRIPLVLTATCRAFRHGQSGTWPVNSRDLWDRIVEDLVQGRHRREDPANRSVKQARRHQRVASLACLVAWRCSGGADGEYTDSFSSEWLDALEGELFADGMGQVSEDLTMSGLITRRGLDEFAFVHKSLAEYLTALAVALIIDGPAVSACGAQWPIALGRHDWREILEDRLWFQTDWDEVVVLAGCASRSVGQYLDWLISHSPDPAFRALTVASRISAQVPGDALVRVVESRVIAALRTPVFYLLPDSVRRQLCTVPGNSLTTALLEATTNSRSPQDRAIAAEELVSRPAQSHTELLFTLARDEMAEIRLAAARALRDEPGTRAAEALLDLAFDRAPRVAAVAIRGLALRGAKERAQALQNIATPERWFLVPTMPNTRGDAHAPRRPAHEKPTDATIRGPGFPDLYSPQADAPTAAASLLEALRTGSLSSSDPLSFAVELCCEIGWRYCSSDLSDGVRTELVSELTKAWGEAIRPKRK